MIMKWDPQAETGRSRKITDQTGSKLTKILTPLTGPLPKKISDRGSLIIHLAQLHFVPSSFSF